MAKEPLTDYPENDPRTAAYEVARTTIDAAASFVPGAGYALGKLVEHVVAAPLTKRRDDWFRRVGEGLRDLEDRLGDFDPARLSENDDFVSAVYEATDAAMRTGNAEKLEALRNGVLNIANGSSIDEVLRGSFFAIVERFSPAHIRTLTLLANPEASPEMKAMASGIYAGSQHSVLRAALPSSVLTDDALTRVLNDLRREGLIDSASLMGVGTNSSLLNKRSTEVGDAFLKFIQKPD